MEAAHQSCAGRIQAVMSLALPPSAPIEQPGYFVYGLVSPFWGRCYVGGTGYRGPRSPLARWTDHLRLAKLWSSETSRTRYGQRCPPLYSAMAAVGLENVLLVVLAVVSREDLPEQETEFTRRLQPVFNVRLPTEDHGWNIRGVASACVDDCLTLGARLLRRAHPRLSGREWAAIISSTAEAGDRIMAAKLARQARGLSRSLGKLRAFPHIVVPCPLPRQLLDSLNRSLHQCLRIFPEFLRGPQHRIMLSTGRVCWSKSPYADAVLAPAWPAFEQIGLCRCVDKAQHFCSRSWSLAPPAEKLFSIVSNRCLSYRVMPSLQRLTGDLESRLKRFLKLAGLSRELTEEVTHEVLKQWKVWLQPYLSSLPGWLRHGTLLRARKPVWEAGLVFVRVDRNPGRLVLMCRERWLELQRCAFLASPRYVISGAAPVSADDDYAKEVVAHFTEWVLSKSNAHIRVRSPLNASRPCGYWTVKQKSTLMSVPPVVKFRPIVAHSRHPCRPFLRRVGRSLSLLVQLASGVVSGSKPWHTAIWQMHQGVHGWLAKLPQHPGLCELLEFDVEDCFLNTPRPLVLQALTYWMGYSYRRRRGIQSFAISKDSKAADHIGVAVGPHHWNLSAATVLASVQWEMDHNSDFEVLGAAGLMVVLRQALGLPIGGHLSAALVELVALHREHTQPWPEVLGQSLSCRYRDNFFVAVAASEVCPLEQTAQALSDLLQMPVKAVSRSSVMRCLEVRISLEPGKAAKSVLAFRTDSDRQGESGDIESWPSREDPRLPMVLPGLLTGLAAKLRFYSAPGVRGYGATVRAMYIFVKAKKYPSTMWLRPFALALVRVGAHPGVLPRPLRRVLGAQRSGVGGETTVN